MDNKTIAGIRLASQMILHTKFKTPGEVVSWMGAMQAQDYNMAKWAIGVRTNNCTNRMVEEAFNRGEILRTHVMRPTWHFVAPEDIRWMLLLTAPRIKSSTKSRDKDLEITEEIYTKTNQVIVKTLEGGKHSTREELAVAIEKFGIVVDSSRLNHFMMRAELDGIVCSGALKGKKHSYALLEERVSPTTPLSKDEALAKLARTYFKSHCPATLQDFIWWSGLSATDARHAMEMVKKDFIPVKTDQQEYWISDSFTCQRMMNHTLIHLLPAFDEYIISYKDRKAVLPLENHSRAVSSNGIFRPVVTQNGQVIGIWKKASVKNKIITTEFFEQPDKDIQELINHAASEFGHFLNETL